MAASGDRYTTVAIALHWVIAVMIIMQIIGGLTMTGLPDGSSEKFEFYQLHKSFGLTVLLLSLVRLGWRLTHPAPALPDGMAGWERIAARFTHVAFYALMIGVPLGGWAVVSASPFADSVPTYIFGVIPWPHLPFFSGVEDRGALTEQLAGAHEFFALTIAALLVLHIGAALKHHFISRDGVLARMAPVIRQRSSS